MHYVEIVEKFDDRGRIEPCNKLEEIAQSHKGELYRSVYLFDESIIEYVKETGSVAKFDGIVYPDKIYLDFDGDTALNYMRASLIDLEDKGVYEGFQVYFSGTGFHIELDSRLFNFEPTPHLPTVVRNTIREVFQDADNIFDKTRLIRYRNTINLKSGLYKVPLTVSEAQTLTIDQIKELATQPRWDFEYFDGIVEDKLSKYVIKDRPSEEPGAGQGSVRKGARRRDTDVIPARVDADRARRPPQDGG